MFGKPAWEASRKYFRFLHFTSEDPRASSPRVLRFSFNLPAQHQVQKQYPPEHPTACEIHSVRQSVCSCRWQAPTAAAAAAAVLECCWEPVCGMDQRIRHTRRIASHVAAAVCHYAPGRAVHAASMCMLTPRLHMLQMEELTTLMAAMCQFIDIVGSYQLSPEARKKADKKRQEVSIQCLSAYRYFI